MAATTSGAAASSALELVVTRAFDAPRREVFKAWSGPDRLIRWWGPRGVTAPAGKVDIGPGGTWRVGMRSAAGGLRWLQCAYREVVEPERLAFTWAWEDPAGRPGRETLVTVNFAEQAGKTRLFVHQAAYEPAAPERPEDDRGGWDDRLDRLADLLNQMPMPEEPTMAASPAQATVAPPSATPELARHPHLRCAAQPGLQGLGPARAPGALVGAQGLHAAVLRDRRAPGWRLGALHALARGQQAHQARRLPRDRRAGAPGLHLRQRGCRRPARPRDRGDRDLRAGCRDQAHAAPDRVRVRSARATVTRAAGSAASSASPNIWPRFEPKEIEPCSTASWRRTNGSPRASGS